MTIMTFRAMSYLTLKFLVISMNSKFSTYCSSKFQNIIFQFFLRNIFQKMIANFLKFIVKMQKNEKHGIFLM